MVTIHKYIHFTFTALLVVTAIICILFILKKLNNPKKIKELSKTTYESMIGLGLHAVTDFEKPMFNIWPYVSRLKNAKILSKTINNNKLVHKVYRNTGNTYEHILLFTETEQSFVVIVADIVKMKVKGFYLLEQGNTYHLT